MLGVYYRPFIGRTGGQQCVEFAKRDTNCSANQQNTVHSTVPPPFANQKRVLPLWGALLQGTDGFSYANDAEKMILRLELETYH